MRATAHNYKTHGLVARILIVVILLLSFGLFFQRDGFNILHYGTPSPECNQVLSVQECSAYAPWYRNHVLAANNSVIRSKLASLDLFKGQWIHIMLNTSFYVTGPGDGGAAPLYLPKIAEELSFVAAVVLFIRYGDRLYKASSQPTRLMILTSLIYIAVLFAQNFQDFIHLGAPVGIQGRYVIPILLPLYWIIARTMGVALGKRNRPIKLAIFMVLLVCMLAGGGALTFIMRSNDSWYWPNSPMIRANAAVRKILSPIIIQ